MNLRLSESACFHETKSWFNCYRCIFQSTERKALGISKALDTAETPQFNLWSETADRFPTQFYFTGAKAIHLVLCLLNLEWLMGFRTFKNTKRSSSESKGFNWCRKETRPSCMVTWRRYCPGVLPEHSCRTGIKGTVLNKDIIIWNTYLPSSHSLLSF